MIREFRSRYQVAFRFKEAQGIKVLSEAERFRSRYREAFRFKSRMIPIVTETAWMFRSRYREAFRFKVSAQTGGVRMATCFDLVIERLSFQVLNCEVTKSHDGDVSISLSRGFSFQAVKWSNQREVEVEFLSRYREAFRFKVAVLGTITIAYMSFYLVIERSFVSS